MSIKTFNRENFINILKEGEQLSLYYCYIAGAHNYE